MNETWKAVPGYEGLYEVSDAGRVRSLDGFVRSNGANMRRRFGKVLRPSARGRSGYPIVNLSREGAYRVWCIHRVVLAAFVGPLPHGHFTRHLNGDKTDNRLVNLHYGTPAENSADEIRLGNTMMGERHGRSVLTEQDVHAIRTSNLDPKGAALCWSVSVGTIYDVRSHRSWRHVA